MRNFLPDETSEVSITLTKKDWLMIAHICKHGLDRLPTDEKDLTRDYQDVMTDLIRQARR